MANIDDTLIFDVEFRANQESLKALNETVKAGIDTGGAQAAAEELKELTKQFDSYKKAQQGASVESKKTDSQLKQARRSLRDQKEELFAVNKAIRDGSGDLQANQARQNELSDSIRGLNAEIQESTRGYMTQQQILEMQPATYNELTQQNRALAIAMKDVPLSDTSGELQRLQAQYDANNTKLKAFDKTIGNSQRNVGNYQSALSGISAQLAVVQGPLGPIAGRITALNTALRMGAGGATGFAAAIRIVGIALVSIPLIAIAGAIGFIIRGFTRLQPVSDAFARFGAATGIIFQRLIDALATIGGETLPALANAFNDPKAAIKELGQLLLDQVINRILAVPDFFIGVFKSVVATISLASNQIKLILDDIPVIGRFIDREAAQQNMDDARADLVASGKQMGDAVLQFATGIKDPIDTIGAVFTRVREEMEGTMDVAREAARLTGILQQVEEDEIALIEKRAAANRNLARTRLDAGDDATALSERIRLLKEVNEEEERLSAVELGIARRKADALTQQLDLASSTREEIKAAAEARARVDELETESIQRRFRATQQLRALERQEEAAANRILEERIRIEDDRMQGRLDAEVAALQRRNMFVAALERERTAIVAQQAQLEAQILKELIDQNVDAITAGLLARERAEAEIANRVAEKDREIEQTKADTRNMIAEQSAQILAQAVEAIFGKGKAAAIAAGLADTYAAANKALATYPPPFSYIAAAAATTFGLRNVARIRSTKIGGAQSGSPQSAPNVSLSSAPSEAFGFGQVDPNAGRQVMSGLASANRSTQVVVNLMGEFDPEILHIKSQQGANMISNRSITTTSPR